MSLKDNHVYQLDIRAPRARSTKYDVIDQLSIGSDDSCDIPIKGSGLAPLQGRFRMQNDVLTFTNLGQDNSCKIGTQKCGAGRMYIIDKGDKIVIDNIKIQIKIDKLKISPETHESDRLSPEDETDPNLEVDPNLEQVDELQDNTTEDDKSENEYETVSEYVYVDEDGNQVDEPKSIKESKPSILFRYRQWQKERNDKRLKTKAKKERSIPPAKRAKNKERTPTAGVFTRLIAILFNIILFLALVHFSFGLLKEATNIDLISYGEKAYQYAQPVINKIPSEIKAIPYSKTVLMPLKEYLNNIEVFSLLALYIVYDLLFHLLLGVSLAAFLMGMKIEGGLILSRLLSPIRVILNYILGPLLIFDTPALLKKATFKELITGIRITNRSSLFSVFSALILLPVIILVLGNIPVIEDFANAQKPIKAHSSSLKEHKEKFNEVEFNLYSETFGKSSKTFISPDLKLIPNFKVLNDHSNVALNILNPIKDSQLNLNAPQKSLGIEKAYELLSQDPIFKYTLNKKLNDKKLNLVKVIFNSLNINLKKPIRSIRKLGPFLGPYYNLKNKLLENLEIKALKEIRLISYNGRSYIILFPNSADLEFFVIYPQEDDLIAIKSEYSDNSIKLLDRILTNFIIHPSPIKKEELTTIDKRITSKELTRFEMAFIIMDIFSMAKKGEILSPAVLAPTIDYYMNLSKDALNSNNFIIQELTLKALNRMDRVLLNLKQKNDDKTLDKLRINLLRIQKALFKREKKFFKIN